MLFSTWFVLFVFVLNTFLLLYFAIKKPYFKIGRVSVESYAVVVLIGPLLLLLFRLINFKDVSDGLSRVGSASPLGILVLFLSMVFISIYLDTVGFMEYCAKVALKYSGNSGKKLFFSLYFMVSVLTVFTSNDIVILTFTPIIYYFAKNLGIDPKPYLLAEFFAANTWSMMLQIGNPTNIFITTAFGIRFFDYLKWMFLPTLLGGVVSVFLIYHFFKKEINKNITHIKTINPSDAIKDWPQTIIGVVLLAFCTVALSVAPYFDISMWVVSLVFALALIILLTFRDFYLYFVKGEFDLSIKKTLIRMPFGVIPFVVSFFVVVHALSIYGVTSYVGNFFITLGDSTTNFYVYTYGIVSAVFSNFLNNIPMSVAFTEVITGLSGVQLFAAALATTIGSNLGANFTPIGALAGIMWMGILKNKGYEISYKEFMYYGLTITSIVLFVTLSVLAIEFSLLT